MNKIGMLSFLFALAVTTPAHAYFQYEKYTEPVVKQEVKKGSAENAIKEIQEQKTAVQQKQESKKMTEPKKVAEPKKAVESKKIVEQKKTAEPKSVIKSAPQKVEVKKEIKSAEFVLEKGSLQLQLDKYSKKNGYTLIWNASNDYLMEAKTVFTGNYQKVVSDLFNALKANGILLRAVMYQNNVLEVKE